MLCARMRFSTEILTTSACTESQITLLMKKNMNPKAMATFKFESFCWLPPFFFSPFNPSIVSFRMNDELVYNVWNGSVFVFERGPRRRSLGSGKVTVILFVLWIKNEKRKVAQGRRRISEGWPLSPVEMQLGMSIDFSGSFIDFIIFNYLLIP